MLTTNELRSKVPASCLPCFDQRLEAVAKSRKPREDFKRMEWPNSLEEQRQRIGNELASVCIIALCDFRLIIERAENCNGPIEEDSGRCRVLDT